MQSMNSTMPKRNRTVPPKECRNHAPLFSQNNRRLVKPVSRWQNKKYPEVLRLQDTFLAYLPLLDTMHHALNTWCIFYWFHFDSQGRWGQKGQNAECSPRSLLSAVPEAFCRQIISGMFLENVRKQSAKPHACVFNTRVRFRYFVV